MSEEIRNSDIIVIGSVTIGKASDDNNISIHADSQADSQADSHADSHADSQADSLYDNISEDSFVDISSDSSTHDNRGYTEKRVKVIELMANRAGALVWMFTRTNKFYKRLHTTLLVIGAILSALLGGSGVTTITALEDFKNVTLGLQITTIVVGVFLTVTALLRFYDKAEKHKWAADKNADLFLDCKKILEIPIAQRKHADKFIHKKLRKEFEIFSDSPHIPKFIIKRYYNVFGARALPYEIIFHFDEDQLLIVSDEVNPSSSKPSITASTSILTKLRMTKKNNISDPDKAIVSSEYRANQVLDDSPRLKIREDVIDRMVEMEEACEVDYKPDFDKISELHDQLDARKEAGIRRRRTSTMPTAAQRFELEKYLS